MPKRLHLTRRFPIALSNDAYRRLNAEAQAAGISPDEFLAFLFENFNSVISKDNFNHRLRLFCAELGARRS